MTALKVSFMKCSVLSLRDSCVFYPSCAKCVSKLEKKQTDRSKYRCPKCGLTCEVGSASYRYRLALTVRRDCHLFPLTVFGSCLNPHFGLSALRLHSLVEESKTTEGNQADHVQQLLLKAVENCFIARCFVFGVKIPGFNFDESACSRRSFPAFLNTKRISRQLIASQIILPDPAVRSSPVVLYFRKLLSAYKHTDLGILQEPWELVALPEHEESTSTNDSWCTVASRGRSLLQHSNGNISVGGFCQQSPGLIMSPAGEENSYTTPEGDAHQRKKGKRSGRSFAHGTPSHYCTSDIKRTCKNKDQLDESCLTSSVSYELGEESVENDLQSSFSSLHSSVELSVATGRMNHNDQNILKNSKIFQKHANQYDNFDPNVRNLKVLDVICAAVAKSNMWNSVMNRNSATEECSFDFCRTAHSYHEKHNNSENMDDFVKCEDTETRESVSTYSSVARIDHNVRERFLAEVKSFSKLSHMFQIRKRREGGEPLSVSGSPVLKTVTEQTSLKEDQNPQMSNSGLLDVSADLFSSFQESNSAGEEINKDTIKALTESEDISQSFNTCPNLNLNSGGDPALNLNVKSNCSACISETGESKLVDFVPFSQSTPIAKGAAALKDFQHRRTNQRHFHRDGISTKQRLKRYHCCQNMQVDDCHLRISDSDSEDLDCVGAKRLCEGILLKNHSSCQTLISHTSAEHNSKVFDWSEDLFCSFNLI
ncbi:DNA damage-induced apoptosis suppressor protein [Arapaima gigas]